MKYKHIYWLPVTILFIFFVSCFFTVDESEHALVTQFGKSIVYKQELGPGLHWKLPWPFQVVQRFDKRIQIYQTPLIEYLTGDKKNIVLQAFVCWRIDDPLVFFGAIRSLDSATQKLDDIITSAIGASLGDYKMSNLVSVNEEEVRVAHMEEIICKSSAVKTKESYGMEVVKVGISRIALPFSMACGQGD